MALNYKQMKNLFLQQSYLDSWEDYERSLYKANFIRWDYVILTSSNADQARTYQEQIDSRLKNGLLPKTVHYAVLEDPDGKRVGSGGATFNVLRYIAEQEMKRVQDFDDKLRNLFKNKRILVIHSGGDSKRIPQYSAIGKLFSPVPRQLPNGRASTLFDEFMIGMSGVPSRIKEGMLVLSGDVLLLFNPLQIDLQYQGAAALSIKEPVETGKNHGVFLNDGNGFVKKFLHKQPESRLKEIGAVNESGNVDLDTGAVVFDASVLNALYSLISSENLVDEEKFHRFVNERAQISFYGDFLYPLAKDASLEQYYKEAAEGAIEKELLYCREKIWDVLSSYSMRLICLSPAEFIHFGTTKELLKLVTEEIHNYSFLNWSNHVISTAPEELSYAVNNAYIGKRAQIETGAYIENSYVLDSSRIGENTIISNVKLRDITVPDGVVLHGLMLRNGKYVVRIYAVEDNPKQTFAQDGCFLKGSLPDFIGQNHLSVEDLWDSQEDSLWKANLYPVCETMDEAIFYARIIYKMAQGTASAEEILKWKEKERLSLYSSFNSADTLTAGSWQYELNNRILSRNFISLLENGMYYRNALKVFGEKGVTEDIYRTLLEDAQTAEVRLKIRIYYALSRYMRNNAVTFNGDSYDKTELLCFQTIQDAVYKETSKKIRSCKNKKIQNSHVKVELPVRVNWGGGWTDTPPHCNEQGGIVLNAAIKLNGIFPIQVEARKLEELHIEFASADIGAYGQAETIQEIWDCHNPYDPFALHKAALIASGIVPLEGTESLPEILENLGGGIYISTQVIGIPKGSGLGTSSILSGACIKALLELLGENISNEEICDIVLGMEQLMSTGGGWQDQVGGLLPGIKMIHSSPGMNQKLCIEQAELSEETMKELQERFALIYTGQRRLARNLLRDVMGHYIGGKPEALQVLHDIQPLAVMMKFELERGNIDAFAELLNRHWELSKQLDAGSTNTCIDQIFMACDDLIDGRFIAGAGGGGFLQVILKKGVSKKDLQKRLLRVFQNSGVDVWDCEFII